MNFLVQISNPFGPLAKWGSDTPIRQNMGNTSASRKHPASSPLDDDYTTKKHREDSDSDTSVQDTEMQSPPHTGLAGQNAQSSSANDNPNDRSFVSDLEIKNNDQNVNSKIPETGDLVKLNIAKPTLAAAGSKSTDDTAANTIRVLMKTRRTTRKPQMVMTVLTLNSMGLRVTRTQMSNQIAHVTNLKH